MDEQMLCANAGVWLPFHDVRCRICAYACGYGGDGCNFCFPDDVIKIEHHSPKLIETVALEEGWYEYLFSYTVPVYYKPSSIDNFSVYSSPAADRPVDYIVKDIVVELI